MKQPAELKTVYDQSYDRDVTQPAKAMVDIFPTVDAATRDIITLADFLAQHRNAVQLQGSLIRVSDPALQRQLQTMLDALRTHQGAIQDAQRKLRAVIYGG